MQQELETSQASYGRYQPRVFYEDFRNAVLYVQNVRGGTGASNWDQVFMADVTDPGNPIITTATSATVVNDSSQELLMRLRDGSRHETVAGQPQQYNISSFAKTDLPLSLSSAKRNASGTYGYRDLMRCRCAHCWSVRMARTAEDSFLNCTSRSFLSRGLPRSHVGWSSTRGDFAPRRKEFGPGFSPFCWCCCTTYCRTQASRLKPAGQVLAIPRRLDGKSSLRQWAAACYGKWRAAACVLSGIANLLSRTPRPRLPGKNNVSSPLAVIGEIFNHVQSVSFRMGYFIDSLTPHVVREFFGMFVLVLASFVMLMLVFYVFRTRRRHRAQSYCPS